MRKTIDRAIIEKIKSYYEQGMTTLNISKKLKISRSAVYCHLRKSKNLVTKIALVRAIQIKELHEQGFSNNQIAVQLSIANSTVGNTLRKQGLHSNFTSGQPPDIVSPGKAQCTKCRKVKSLDCFHKVERKKYSYSYSFCKNCRNAQINASINKDIASFFRYRLRKLAVKCKRKEILFSISLDSLLKKFSAQEGKCFYTEEIFIWQIGEGHNKHQISFDKVIPELGYTDINTILCTTQANAVKNDLTLEEIKNWLPSWYQKIQTLPQFEMLKEASINNN